MRALHEQAPSLRVHVSTTVDPAWLESGLGFAVHYRHQAYEPGAMQLDCFRVDIPATIQAYRAFRIRYDDYLEAEVDFLRSDQFIAVVSDIPALPIAAASKAGLPAIGVSNFTWDWLIEPWCASEEMHLVDELRADYATGTIQLCLPFGPDRSSFPAWEAAPLISRRARIPRARVRDLLGISDGPVALVCPGGWTADEWPAIEARAGRFEVVTVNNLPVTSTGPCRDLGNELPFDITMPDLIAAADVVLGKPGYGLASECLTHRVPFAMIERPNFRETPYVVSRMRDLGRCSSMTLETFFSGQWESTLEEAIADDSDWQELEPAPEQTIASRLLAISTQDRCQR
jgi:L-arabinokinase